MKHNTEYFPHLGFGLGLRIPHYAHIFEHTPPVDWFEINYSLVLPSAKHLIPCKRKPIYQKKP